MYMCVYAHTFKFPVVVLNLMSCKEVVHILYLSLYEPFLPRVLCGSYLNSCGEQGEAPGDNPAIHDEETVASTWAPPP
jgi:hypothetical protein